MTRPREDEVPPAAKVCVFDGGTLIERRAKTPFTMHTPIGSPSRSWLDHWECESCGLMYAPGIMPDPEIERAAERKRQEEEAWKGRMQPYFDRVLANRPLTPATDTPEEHQ